MAGPSDKARFYLEQSAAELNDLERKKVFTTEEISSIARQRSDFEHIVNARGSNSSEYLRYITFEKNVEALRRKRIKRLGLRHKGAKHRIVYSLYHRATRKFSGDLTLWMQYIDFARKDKAYKRLNDIFTSVARLHPTSPGIWILAATYFIDTQADMSSARSYMQRGLRFCKSSDHLWLEYAKLEMVYVAKINGRRRVLGLDVIDLKKPKDDDIDDENELTLPQITIEDMYPNLRQGDHVDEEALSHLTSAAPILTGAIPLAIFDSAMKQFQGRPGLARHFFEMFAEFEQLSCTVGILQHVLDFLHQNSPQTIDTALCGFRMKLLGVKSANAELALALRDALELISFAIEQHPDEAELCSEVVVYHLLSFEQAAVEDPSLDKALRAAIRKYVLILGKDNGSGDRIASLAMKLLQEGRKDNAKSLILLCVKYWPTNKEFGKLESMIET